MGLAEKLKDIEEEIKDLSKEEKERKVAELLNSLPPEELEELKKQQCIFCLIASGDAESFTVYEDNLVKAVLDIKPASKGHVVLFPKEHYALTTFMSDELTGHMFKTANMLSKTIFGVVKAQGTNIYVANGFAAGQMVSHVMIHIIPRFENDKLVIPWKGKEIKNDELKIMADEIKSKIIIKKDLPKKEEVKTASVAGSKRRMP